MRVPINATLSTNRISSAATDLTLILSISLESMDGEYAAVRTSVFWDVDEFPIPIELSYQKTIRSALEKRGCVGELSITAYGEKKPDNLDDGIPFILKSDFLRTQKWFFLHLDLSVVDMHLFPGDKYWRLNRMLFDIGVLRLKTPRSYYSRGNLMLIAKNISEGIGTVLVELLRMARLSFDVIFVLPDDHEEQEKVQVPFVHAVWLWKSLLGEGKPMDPSLVSELIKARKPIAPVYLNEHDTPCPMCGKTSHYEDNEED